MRKPRGSIQELEVERDRLFFTITGKCHMRSSLSFIFPFFLWNPLESAVHFLKGPQERSSQYRSTLHLETPLVSYAFGSQVIENKNIKNRKIKTLRNIRTYLLNCLLLRRFTIDGRESLLYNKDGKNQGDATWAPFSYLELSIVDRSVPFKKLIDLDYIQKP
jgi:hypothetical protein